MVGFKRCGEEMLARHKHDHIIGRGLKLVPIRLGPKRVDMRLHRGGVRGEPRHPLALIGCAKRILIGIQRHFGINHQRPPAGYQHNRIGAQSPLLAFHAHLGLKIGMFGKPAHFEDVFQLLLAPSPACFRRIAQRIAKLCRLTAYRFVADPHRFHQPLEVAIRLAPFRFDLGNRLFITLEPLCHGLEQRL